MNPTEALFLLQDVILGVLLVVAIAIALVATLSYLRTRSRRILFVMSAFIAILIKSLVLVYMLYMGMLELDPKHIPFLDLVMILDLVSLILIYAAIFR